MIYQMTFAIITVALVAGSVADRMRFSAFLVVLRVLAAAGLCADRALGLGRRLPRQLRRDRFRRRHWWCISMPASPDWSRPMWSASGAATAAKILSPHDLTLAVIGTGLLWVGWFGFNGGSALGANSRAAMAIVATHLAASTGAFTWMALEWWTRGKPSVLGMISGAVAGLGTITPASGFVLPMQAVLIGLIAGAVCFWACTWLKIKMRLRRLARRVRRARRRRLDRHLARRRAGGRRAVGEPRTAGRRAWPDRRQSAAGAGAALRRSSSPCCGRACSPSSSSRSSARWCRCGCARRTRSSASTSASTARRCNKTGRIRLCGPKNMRLGHD